MHSDLVELGWTEEHLNRIYAVVTEEAQKARVAAQMLSIVGSVESSAVAIPSLQVTDRPDARLFPPTNALRRLSVDTDPNLFLTKIAVNVAIRTRDAADPSLEAALSMFRRAASYVARLEDAVVFNGFLPNLPLLFGAAGIPAVFEVSGNGPSEGIFLTPAARSPRAVIRIPIVAGAPGNGVVTAVSAAIGALEGRGHFGPFACALSPTLFNAICMPTANLVLPRDRLLPLLQGPLLRASAIFPGWGAVIALGGNAVEVVVASDIQPRYLQTNEEPRLVFQVAERVALRIKESAAIALLN